MKTVETNLFIQDNGALGVFLSGIQVLICIWGCPDRAPLLQLSGIWAVICISGSSCWGYKLSLAFETAQIERWGPVVGDMGCRLHWEQQEEQQKGRQEEQQEGRRSSKRSKWGRKEQEDEKSEQPEHRRWGRIN